MNGNSGFFGRVCGLYRLMVRAYPPRFRARYEREMVQAFSDELRATVLRGSAWGMMRFLMHMGKDLGLSASRERIREISPVGVLCLLAGIAFGIYGSYVDRRSATEVYPTLCVVLAGSFVLGLIRPAHAWRWAMVVAVWVPFLGALPEVAHRMVSPGAWAILGILMVPGLIGAFGGSALRRIGEHMR
jgi:hypothetical protein